MTLETVLIFKGSYQNSIISLIEIEKSKSLHSNIKFWVRNKDVFVLRIVGLNGDQSLNIYSMCH